MDTSYKNQKADTSYRGCTAQAKRTQRRCRAPAIRGTDKCRVHGGLTPVKHGLYSKYLSESIRKKYEAFLADENLKDLSSEIARLRAILAQMDESNLAQNTRHLPLFLATCETISRLVERQHKVEVGERYTISVENVQLIINQVVAVVNRHVKDRDVRLAIAASLEKVASHERDFY